MGPQLQYCMQFGVLRFKSDMEHLEILKQAMKIVEGKEDLVLFQSLYWYQNQKQTKPPPCNLPSSSHSPPS